MTDQAILQAIAQRGITEVVHFTTNNGLVGILHTGRLSANAFLKDEERLEHILKINSADRSRDAGWLEFVNISLSEINDYFFGFSQRRMANKDAYWCILSFDSSVLAHPGVHFSTTNNAYELTERAKGAVGLEALFQPVVRRKSGWAGYRSSSHGAHQPTCRQAEALYPGHLSLAHLRAIYVEDGPVYDEVHAQVSLLAPNLLNKIEIIIDANRFK